MRVTIAHVKGMCASTKCPVVQGWCKWAGMHRELAYGMLLAKVEPWKYAIGRCWHDGHHGHHQGPPVDHHDPPPPMMMTAVLHRLGAMFGSGHTPPPPPPMAVAVIEE